ncbi:inositol monophosphatase family protein [Anaeromicrobium sediminis]|uniref:Inositol-1-monophosphatase n=1 Tax=Anaeromicrobium sediminis TaxID=1478221 RepID=A0A267MIB0_9FIRM|nr:inositol monophosphatase family protein [Anaeromicrobium sediminis]PAB59152.1 hypothetical protein CCE28_11580 [Anaeromicrobium sediminis]
MKFYNELNIAKEAAKLAGVKLIELSKESCDVISSVDKDIKLKADKDSEQVTIDYLKKHSNYSILSEENGLYGNVDNNTPFWIVDPLDGTANYSKNIPISCVSIALWEKNNPILGVVYDFNRNELFYGIVGKGAWCNKQSISVSKITNSKHAILATGFPIFRDYSINSLKPFIEQIQEYKKIRMLGSAALSLAYVASGRIDIYTEEDIMLWDVAAGIALVKAAGGYIYMRNSNRHEWARKVVCASNRYLWKEGYKDD